MNMLLCLLLYLSTTHHDKDIFHQANAAYDKQNYTVAAELYRQLLQHGYRTGDIYYNLGMAYFKSDNIGYAIGLLRIAQQHMPRYTPIHHSLRIAREKIKDRIDPPEASAPIRILFFWHFMLNTYECLLGAMCMYTLWCVTYSIRYLKPMWLKNRLFKYVQHACCMVFVLLSISWAWRTYLPRDTVVMTAAEVNVHAGIGHDTPVRFMLHAGTEAYMLHEKEQHNETWLHIQLTDGKQGWVSKSCLIRC